MSSHHPPLPPSKHVSSTWFFALFAILLAPCLHAGVTMTLGGGSGIAPPGTPQTLSALGSITDADRTLLRTTPIRVRCRDGRWSATPSLFLTLNDPQIDARLVVLRQMVLSSIEEMEHHASPRVRRQALCLRNSYNRNQIKIDLTDECHDSTTEAFEGTPDPTSDEITLSIRLFLQRGLGNCDFQLRTSTPDFSDLGLIRLHGALLHESRHILQDFRPTLVPGEHTSQVDARIQKKIYENEIAATTLELEAITAVLNALASLNSSGAVPGGASHFAQQVANDFQSTFPTGPALNAALNAVIAQLTPHAQHLQFLLEERIALRDLHQAFLAGDFGAVPFPGVGKFHDALRRIRWHQIQRSSPGGEIRITARGATLGAGGTILRSNILRQESPTGVTEFAVTGIDFISGLMVFGDGSHLLVLGGEESTGDGILYGFHDSDADGIFEKATQTEAARSDELFLAALAHDFAAGQILALGFDTKDIVQLATTGTSSHPYPDYTEPRGAIGYDREDLRSLKISSDGLHAFAAPDFSVATWGSSKWLHASTSAVGGEFIPDGPWCPTEHHLRTPIFSVVPGGGYSFMQVYVFPGSTICITIIFGPENQVIAKQIIFTPGSTRVSFGTVIYPGYIVQIDDMTNGLQSVQQSVWGPVQPTLSPPAFEGQDLLLDLQGMPETDYTLNYSPTLGPWNPLDLLTTDGYGLAFFDTPKGPLGSRNFFQAKEYVP